MVLGSLDGETVEGCTPRQLARIVREVLLASALPPERYGLVDGLLGEVLEDGAGAGGGGGGGSWRAAARAIWDDVQLFYECDAVPSLRSRIREAGVGSVLEAITSLVSRAIVQRSDEISWYISIHAGRVWIPDALFPPFQYLLEMNDWGCHPSWSGDRDLSGLLQDPVGPGGVWQLWLVRCGGEPERGFLATQVYAGSLPAWGMPERSAGGRPLARLIRTHPSPVAVLALTEPALLALAPEGRLPSAQELLTASRSPAEREALRFPFHPHDYQRHRRREPLAALRSYLAHTGERSLGRALVAIIEMALVALAPLGRAGPQGTWCIPLEVDRTLPPAQVLRSGPELLVDAEGVAATVALLGLFPCAYRADAARPVNWDWETLVRCGWGGLAAAGRWQTVGIAGRSGLWVRFPPSPRTLASSIPDAGPVRDHPLAVEALARCAMDIDAPWDPPA